MRRDRLVYQHPLILRQLRQVPGQVEPAEQAEGQ
jgi:hypothetical protein